MGRLSGILLIQIGTFLASMPSLCLTSSDPMTSLCTPICWEEDALADQCVHDRCEALPVHSRAYRQCQDGCWEATVVPCRLMCSDHSLAVLRRCERVCAGAAALLDEDEDCHMDCFTHRMMRIKARVLPHDYLAEFEREGAREVSPPGEAATGPH